MRIKHTGAFFRPEEGSFLLEMCYLYNGMTIKTSNINIFLRKMSHIYLTQDVKIA